MCEPASITAGVMALAGTAMTMAQQRAVQDNRNKAMSAAADAQGRHAREARKSFNDSTELFSMDKQKDQREQISDTRGQKIAANISDSGSYDAPTAASAPRVVKTQVAKGIYDALESGRGRAMDMGSLGSWGELDFDNRIALNRNAGKIAERGLMAMGSVDHLPMALANANSAGQGYAMAGDALKAGGQFSNVYGAENNVTWDDVFGGRAQPKGANFGPYGKNGMRPY